MINYYIIPGLRNWELFPASMKIGDTAKINSILDATCEQFDITETAIKKRDRTRTIINARFIAISLIKESTKLSLHDIGLIFGGQDHTTIIHAVSTCSDLNETDPDFRRNMERIRARISLYNYSKTA